RIEEPHLRVERYTIRLRYVRWVRYDEMEGAAQGVAPIGAKKMRPTGEPEPAGIGAGDGCGGRIAVDADAFGSRPLREEGEQQAAGAGPEIEDARGLRCMGERGLDQGLAVWPRVERRGAENEVQAPEFAPPDDARHRLARRP